VISLSSLKQQIEAKGAQLYFYKKPSILPFISIYSTIIKHQGKVAKGYSEAIKDKNGFLVSTMEAIERLTLFTATPKINNSNGIAIHTLEKEAQNRALCELLEREITQRAWLSEYPFAPIIPQTIKLKILITILKKIHDWSYSCFTVKTDRGVYLCSYLKHPDKGFVFDATFRFEQNLITSMQLNLIFSHLRQITHEPKIISQFSEDKSPITQIKFYRNPLNSAALKTFKLNQSSKLIYTIPSAEKFKSIKLTNPLQTPTYCYQYSNDNFLPLKWGNDSIINKEGWPHPIG